MPVLLAAALAKQAIPPQLGDPVRRLILGEISPLEFPCCNTGCMPCNKDYLRAAEQVLVGLADGPVTGRRPTGMRPWWAFWRKG